MDKQRVLSITLTLIIAVLVFSVLIVVGGEQMRNQRDGMNERANTVYGDYENDSAYAGGGASVFVPVPAESDEYSDRELIENHLYVTGYTYEVGPLASDLDLSEETVKAELRKLEEEGIVDSGYTKGGFFISFKEWVHTAHGDLPDSRWSPYASVLPVVGILIGIVVLIGLIQRYRGESDG